MPKKPSRKDYAAQIDPSAAPPCQIDGCKEPGAYKAPKSKDKLHDYQWLCLGHIREYNQKWDYFKGMDSDQIEAFMQDAVTGHRPTWSRESRIRHPMETLEDALYEFMAMNPRKSRKPIPPISAKLRKALSHLDIEYPYTAKALKIQYRALVKKHHPDVNKGDKNSEEKFKKITASYHMLLEHIKIVQ